MIYLTGEHALNIECELNTCGDWHTSALAWKNLTLRESENSFFGDYGIEEARELPYCNEIYPVANHIRALLDLLYERNYPIVQGMRDDFICTDEYDEEIFDHVMQMKELPYFSEIDEFMGKEYMMKWVQYKKEKGLDNKNLLAEYRMKPEDLIKSIENEISKRTVRDVAIEKMMMYANRGNLIDIFNMTYICNKYWENLNEETKDLIRGSFEYKNLEYFDYIIHTQCDCFIDKNELTEEFLKVARFSR